MDQNKYRHNIICEFIWYWTWCLIPFSLPRTITRYFSGHIWLSWGSSGQPGHGSGWRSSSAESHFFAPWQPEIQTRPHGLASWRQPGRIIVWINVANLTDDDQSYSLARLHIMKIISYLLHVGTPIRLHLQHHHAFHHVGWGLGSLHLSLLGFSELNKNIKIIIKIFLNL